MFSPRVGATAPHGYGQGKAVEVTVDEVVAAVGTGEVAVEAMEAMTAPVDDEEAAPPPT